MENQFIEDCEIGERTDIAEFVSLKNCKIGDDVEIWRFVNLYGCTIGDECLIGSLVEIQNDVKVGARSRIQSHAFVCSRVTIEEDVFVSHGAKFINDRYAPSGNPNEWESTIVRDGASIGTNATLLPVEIGKNAIIGAGAVVVDDVPDNAVVVGNPGKVISYRE